MEFENVLCTSTVALLWRVNKQLWVICNTVIMDFILCVLKQLNGMYEIVFYVSSVLKKCIYLPEGVYGDMFNAYFEGGKQNDCYSETFMGFDFHLFVFKTQITTW